MIARGALEDMLARIEIIGEDLERLKSLLRFALGDPSEPAQAALWPPDPLSVNLHDGSWLTRKQAADEFKVHERTVDRWIETGDISLAVRGRIWISRRRLLSDFAKSAPSSPRGNASDSHGDEK